jgi:hypothetical protein
MKFDNSVFLENRSRKLESHLNSTRITGALLENVFTFMTISRLILLRVKNVLDKVEKIKTHVLCSIKIFENRVVYEMMSKNLVEPERPQLTSRYGTYKLHAG